MRSYYLPYVFQSDEYRRNSRFIIISNDGKDSKPVFSSADPTVGLVMTRSPPSDVARRDRAPLAAMGFFSFTRSKSSASAAAKKASSPQDSWLNEAVIRFLQVRATFRAFSRHHVRSDTQRRDGTLSSNGRTTRLASRPLPDFRRVLLLAQGPMYTHPLISFIDHHCAVFDDEDENKLEYTSIHAEFKRLVETLLSEFLVEVGVPPARFVQVVADSAGGELNDFVLGSILTVDDFVQFKAMMVRRNVNSPRKCSSSTEHAPTRKPPPPPPPPTRHPPRLHPHQTPRPNIPPRLLWTVPSTTTGSTAGLWRRRRLRPRVRRRFGRARDEPRTRRATRRRDFRREAALARAVPEFEDDTTAPEPDDGFDEGALEQAMKLSEAQFEADAIAKRDRATRRAEEASAAAMKAAATAEAARAMADAAAATERPSSRRRARIQTTTPDFCFARAPSPRRRRRKRQRRRRKRRRRRRRPTLAASMAARRTTIITMSFDARWRSPRRTPHARRRRRIANGANSRRRWRRVWRWPNPHASLPARPGPETRLR